MLYLMACYLYFYICLRQTKQHSQLFLPHQDDCNWTQSNAQQNIEQLQNPAIGATTNNETTAAEPPPQNGQQPNSLVCVCVGGVKAFLNAATKASP